VTHWASSAHCKHIQWDLSPTAAAIRPKSAQTCTLGAVVVVPYTHHHGEEGTAAPAVWPQACSNTAAIALFGRENMCRNNTPGYSPFAKLWR